MLPFRLVYHTGYELPLGEHVFPAHKYHQIHDRLLAEGMAQPDDFLSPAPVRDEDLLRVHDRGWIDRLHQGTLSAEEVQRLELPYSRQLVEAFLLMTGGTLLAARRAVAEGFCFHIGGGFHHAFAAHGEGFCAINDVAVAIRTLQHEGVIQRAAVLDCDVHHGNGTASIFAQDPSVYTISLHQRHNYPFFKPPSDLDVHLPDGTGDDAYLAHLQDATAGALASDFRPDLLVYLAGADPYREDRLGGLALTMEGLRRRDEFVFEFARQQGLPVAVVLAGGYAARTEDTVEIHCQTLRAAL